MRTASLVLAIVAVMFGATTALHAGEPVEADVCIYGGTSGGVVAAVQAARMGKRAVIVEPGAHLGGMTAGGLSAVDIGDPRSIGGIAREYFTALAGSYGAKLSWEKDHEGNGGPATGGAFSIEPHTAEALFETMVRDAKVPVYRNARLARVVKDDKRIVEIVTEDGAVFRAKVFIDTTYEGDLMAGATVAYTTTREGNAKYGESLNGIRYETKYTPRKDHKKPGPNGRVPGGQGVWDRDLPLDPYVIPGDPTSGLLPLVEAGDTLKEGAPASGVQAYCFRLCLTDRKENLIPITPPANYDPKRYELVARFIAGCQALGDDMDLRWFSKYDPLPNGKYDFNTATFGGNLPSASWEWPEATYARRVEIAKAHEDYHRGLLHFLATDPRVPEKVRTQMQRFGLPKDEFAGTGGWPHQIYVREGRRMVSDFVMTEHHTFGRAVAENSVGLGSYGTDTHEIRRIVKDGVVTREGKTGQGRGGFGPYQIGYGAIVPPAVECENLFVTFALSASHTAFSSIRMEPVFMVTSQSAATAGCMAIDAGVAVQKVDYAKLRERLVADKQVLDGAPAKKAAPKKTAEAAGENPVPAAKPAFINSARAEDISGKSYDLVVVGGTGSGVMCAVRAAREGCSVLLVNHTQHLGGMMANGLMQWDALYGGARAPLFSELLKNIETHYKKTYGEDSNDAKLVRYSHEKYPIGWAEPHIAEREFSRLAANEKNITVLLGHYPAAVSRDGALLRGVTLRSMGGDKEIVVQAGAFADATYEGDLFALAKVPYRVGREARDEFNEPHAGKVFVNIAKGKAPRDAVEGRLNIRPYDQQQGGIDPKSPFTADGAVQAYNYRFCVTNDPKNRILPEKPATYNRDEYLNYHRKSIATNPGPNRKSHMNSPILPGENHAYPEADWPAREKIIRRHLDFALGLMYFLQNDESLAPAKRAEFRQWGLPKDEFADNNHVPYEMYVREARRIVGRHVYTQHDNSMAPGLGRAPIQPDSVAITDWYMDSHSCTTDSRPGYAYDGKLILTEESRPGQIPYRSLLPKEIDNLVVPVCLSATHVAWGAVRLEPVWMQTGESAGLAVALAKAKNVSPAQLDGDLLARTLAERRMLVTFLNDVDVGANEAWIPAAQYFGTQGFIHDYNARMSAPLKQSTATVWAAGFNDIRQGKRDPNALARVVAEAERADSPPVSRAAFEALLSRTPAASQDAGVGLTRSEAMLMMWESLNRK